MKYKDIIIQIIIKLTDMYYIIRDYIEKHLVSMFLSLILVFLVIAIIWYKKNANFGNLMLLGGYFAGLSAVITAISSIVIAYIVNSLTRRNQNTNIYFQEINKLHRNIIDSYYCFRKANCQGDEKESHLYQEFIKNDSLLLLYYVRAYPLKVNSNDFERFLTTTYVKGITDNDSLKKLNTFVLCFYDQVNPNKLLSRVFYK